VAEVAPISKEEIFVRDLQLRSEILTAAREQLDLAVIRARQEGLGWSVIARALSMTRQAAAERFGKLPQTQGLGR
jgi:hypothetical protein